MIVGIIATEDKSYYVDELEKLTRKPRRYWVRFGLAFLERRLWREIRT